MAKTPKNNSGQALIETALILPPLSALIAGLLAGFYFFLAVQWCDYWVYRGNMCLVENNSPRVCEKRLKEKVHSLVPENNFHIEELWITLKQAKIRAHIKFGDVFQRSFASNISLPLRP